MTKDNLKSEQPNRIVSIKNQFVKDLSFENPGIPNAALAEKKPNINVNISVNTKSVDKELQDVTLNVNIEAKIEDEIIFITELAYTGIFHIDVPAEEKEPVTMVYCPSLLFPYARRIVSDVTRDGGFPPIMLDPIDFAVLFNKRKQQESGKTTQ